IVASHNRRPQTNTKIARLIDASGKKNKNQPGQCRYQCRCRLASISAGSLGTEQVYDFIQERKTSKLPKHSS
ncbi:MAG: hypothetical protein ACR2OJ_10225, partial [Hyphomicrobiales bacterium]